MPTGKSLLEQMNRLTIIPDALAIWGLGQMGVAVKGPDGLLVIDAYLSDDLGSGSDDWARAYPPPIEPDMLTHVTHFLASHEHGDHFDPVTAAQVAKAAPAAHFIAPGWCDDKLKESDIAHDRVIIPPAMEAITLPGTTARLTALPSAHYEKEYDEQKGYRWLGFLIEWNGVIFYHAGDTIIYPGYVDMLRGIPQADLAMLPVNGRDWQRETVLNATGNLHPAEAAWLTNELGWGTVIIGHNDMFPTNAIPYGHIADAFEKAAPRQQYKILQPGELYYFVK